MRKMKDKEERAQQMKMYKQEMLMNKKGVQEENNKQKKQVMELFDKMMRNSNSISPEMILEMFPGEQVLINKLMMLKDVARGGSPMSQGGDQATSLNSSYQNSV